MYRGSMSIYVQWVLGSFLNYTRAVALKAPSNASINFWITCILTQMLSHDTVHPS